MLIVHYCRDKCSFRDNRNLSEEGRNLSEGGRNLSEGGRNLSEEGKNLSEEPIRRKVVTIKIKKVLTIRN